jgi:hypothetical protein
MPLVFLRHPSSAQHRLHTRRPSPMVHARLLGLRPGRPTRTGSKPAAPSSPSGSGPPPWNCSSATQTRSGTNCSKPPLVLDAGDRTGDPRYGIRPTLQIRAEQGPKAKPSLRAKSDHPPMDQSGYLDTPSGVQPAALRSVATGISGTDHCIHSRWQPSRLTRSSTQ